MDKLTIWEIIFMSVPEQLLMVLTILALADLKEFLNIKERKNVFRLLLATFLMATSADISRAFLPVVWNPAILVPIFYVIIILIYRRHPFICLLSLLSMLFIFIGVELLILFPVLRAFNVEFTRYLATPPLFRILTALPIMVIRLFIFLIILKIRKINLQMIKPSKDIWFSVLIFVLCFISNLFLVNHTLENNTNFVLSFTIFCCSSLSFWVLNKLLIMNEQLKQHAMTMEELAVSKERNRLAREVHDILGHSMILLLNLLEVCRITCEKDPKQTKEKLTKAITITREGLNEIKRSVSGLMPERLDEDNIVKTLEQLILNFRTSGLNVDLSLDGDLKPLKPLQHHTIYRICQEALTNSLRHGKATKADIILRFTDKQVKLFIFDNGCGCKEIKKGLGLKGMQDRVRALHGTIVYGSDGESGFNIRAEMPLNS